MPALSFRERLQERVDAMQRDDRFQGVAFSPNPPVDPEVLDRVKKEAGISLPPPLHDLYAAMDGFSLSWTFSPSSGEVVEGDVFIVPLAEMFGCPNGMAQPRWRTYRFEDVLWFDDTPPKNKKVLKQAKRFEIIRGVGMEVILLFEGDEARPVLLYDEDLVHLPIDLETYLGLLLETRGAAYWQSGLLDAATLDRLHVQFPSPKRIQGVFPDASLDALSGDNAKAP